MSRPVAAKEPTSRELRHESGCIASGRNAAPIKYVRIRKSDIHEGLILENTYLSIHKNMPQKVHLLAEQKKGDS